MSHSDQFMNGPLNTRSGADWGELLSAYVDNEVSPADRQLVEQRLAESSEYRELLQDLQTLSVSIRDLPAALPPNELRTTVLQQAHQQQSVVRPPLVKIRSWRREWWVAALATTATAVVVMVLPIAGRRPADLQLAKTADGLEYVAAGTKLELDGARLTTFADNETVADFSPRAERPMTRNAPMDADFRLKESEAFEKRGEPAKSDSAEAWSEDSPEAKLETWEDLQPYLSLLSQNPGTVANVDVIVVDVKQAADQFEVLLLKNGVAVMPEEPQAAAAPAPSAATAEEGNRPRATTLSAVDGDKNVLSAGVGKSGTPAGPKKQDESGELVAVYVEANGEPITKALAEMVRQRSLVAMKLQPPLQLPGNQRGLSDNSHLGDAERNSSMELARLTPELRDAYRQNTAAFQQALDGVSAEDGLENQPPEPERLVTGRMQKSMAGAALPEAMIGDAPASGQNAAVANNSIPLFNTVPMDVAVGNSLSWNFSQRLTLPSSPQAFGTEVTQSQSQLLVRNSAAGVPAIQRRAGNSGEAERYWLSQSPNSNGNLAASQAVRVLFVLQQAPEARPAPE